MLQCRSPPFLLGKPKNPREVWISGTSAQHCGTFIQAKECSRRIRRHRGSSCQTLVLDHPSVAASRPPFLLLCISPALCMGGEALAGCQSACGGVNGQPSAHNMLWTSDTARCTNERLQACLVRMIRQHDLLMVYLYWFFVRTALRLSCMQSTAQPGERCLCLFSGIWWAVALLTYVPIIHNNNLNLHFIAYINVTAH